MVGRNPVVLSPTLKIFSPVANEPTETVERRPVPLEPPTTESLDADPDLVRDAVFVNEG